MSSTDGWSKCVDGEDAGDGLCSGRDTNEITALLWESNIDPRESRSRR